LKLSILFGGASYEHEISIVSAITVKGKLDSFDLSYIFCDQDHTFYNIPEDKMKAKVFSSGEYKKLPILELNRDGFTQKKFFGSKSIDGIVLNLIHGGDGEDGSIAALLDFYSINFIGPRKEASVFSFDKEYTKWLASSLAVKTLQYAVVTRDDNKELAYPCIIKPACLGSSIGVSIVKSEDELEYALDVAFEFDSRVVVEPFIENVKEYNLAGCLTKKGMQFSIVEEPNKEEFLDFDKKYMDFSRSEQVLKADISDELVQKMRDTFEKIYRGHFEGALIRCDFFVINNTVYLNEINPIPGSMANYLFEDFELLISDLASSLPRLKRPSVNYQYIHNISKAKGK
jgi:D-alanine-D-alanine ligase